jgi:hypothetical protein
MPGTCHKSRFESLALNASNPSPTPHILGIHMPRTSYHIEEEIVEKKTTQSKNKN